MVYLPVAISPAETMSLRDTTRCCAMLRERCLDSWQLDDDSIRARHTGGVGGRKRLAEDLNLEPGGWRIKSYKSTFICLVGHGSKIKSIEALFQSGCLKLTLEIMNPLIMDFLSGLRVSYKEHEGCYHQKQGAYRASRIREAPCGIQVPVGFGTRVKI